MKRVFEYEFQGRKITVEHGELAKQAGGAVLVRYNDTVILSILSFLSSNIRNTYVISNNISVILYIRFKLKYFVST